MTYTYERVTPAHLPAIRSFMSNVQLGASVPWNWLNDRLSFTFAVSCAMHETNEEEWASRAALYRDGNGDIASVVLTEGENRGEVFFMSGPDELPEELIRRMLGFAEEHSASHTADGGRIMHLRIDPRFSLRAAIAVEHGFTRTDWSEPLSRFALDAARPVAEQDRTGIPAGYTLIEGPEPRLKSICHSRAFGYAEDEAMRARNEAGFAKLTTMPDHMPFLDLLLVSDCGEPAAMMGFWYDGLLRSAMLEPAGTAPDHRRKGLGRILVNEGANRLRRLGARSLWVGSDQRFYLDCGFETVHRWDVYTKKWQGTS